jgi:hypothetical protein
MCFEQLNLNTITYATIIDHVGLELEENMFGVGVSIEESFRTLVTLSCFCLEGSLFPLLHVEIH